MNTQPKPSVGALRAARAVMQAYEHGTLFTSEMAEIIDAESGLAELLEAAKLLLADLQHDPHSKGYDSVAIAESAIARAETPNAATVSLHEALDALRGMIGLIQLIDAREPDLKDNHRFIEAMRVIAKAENPNTDTKQVFLRKADGHEHEKNQA